MKFSSKFLAVIVGIIFFSAIFVFVDFSEVMTIFAAASSYHILIFIIVSILLVILLVARWNLVLHSQGFKQVKFFRLLRYWMAGYAVSYVTPCAHVGGEPIRAYFLTKENIPFHEGLSTVLIDKALELTLDMFFALCGIVMIVLYFPISSAIKATLIVILSPMFALFFSFYYRVFHEKTFLVPMFKAIRLHKLKSLHEWEQKLSQIEIRIIAFFKHDKKAFTKSLIISLIIWALMFLEYRFALHIVGIRHPSVTNIFMALSVVGIAYIMPIPAALGVLEASQASLFAMIKAPVAKGVALSFLIRSRDLIWTAIGFSIISQQAVTTAGKKLILKLTEKKPDQKIKNE